MRTTMKGGVWKNSEDEILKAAVMKYGLNNWSRVASLLVRKSAKQCKSRWYEWLDPSVKKTEWTREEEEKLLHLAKLFPNQWRTIAPVVGRTAHQCLEHYDLLLDQAQGKTAEDRANDPRRLRPGEIDPHPETKPSRADAVDMEDDEKEMLAEARARLANTRGKKAKRKAREKQLEEARRLAALQKRRELKAAGLGVPRWKKKDDAIDYGSEVPFEQQPPKGFYGIGPEETPASVRGFGNVALQQLEGERRINEEKRLRKEDSRKLKRLMDENLPEAVRLIEKINDPQSFRKKTKLTLPEPQLNEEELRDIVSFGSSRSPAITTGEAHSNQLLQSIVRDPMSTQMMTPMRTPARENAVLLEAQNAAARIGAPTPLEGGINPTLHDVSMGPGATPLMAVPQTPNPLSSGLALSAAATPFTNRAESTPFRDVQSLASGSGQGSLAQDALLKIQVRSALTELPGPQNEIEVAIPDAALIEEESETQIEEDAEEKEKRLEAEALRLKEIEFKKRTKVIQQSLPRPLHLDKIISHLTPASQTRTRSNLETAGKLIDNEMNLLIINDAAKFPISIKGYKVPKEIPTLQAFELDELNEAEAMVTVECADNNDVEALDPSPEMIAHWDNLLLNGFMLDKESNEYIELNTATEEMRLDAVKQEFVNLRSIVAKEAQRAKKLEQKLSLLTKGYANRATKSVKNLDAKWNELKTASIDYQGYLELERREKEGIITRKNDLKNLLNAEKTRHSTMQILFASLISRRDELKQTYRTRSMYLTHSV